MDPPSSLGSSEANASAQSLYTHVDPASQRPDSSTSCSSVLESHPFEQIDPDTYFTSNPPPPHLVEHERQLAAFIAHHQAPTPTQPQRTTTTSPRKVVLVTSGGTIVPLENNTVRFIDNFSAGTRGSASAEFFLVRGYAVIFLYRERSLQPFARHFGQAKGSVLDYLVPGAEPGQPPRVKPEYAAEMATQLARYQEAIASNSLLMITFTTLTDYLFHLRAAAKALSVLGPRAMYYLAAAVSDFFIPAQRMVEHKIQSADGGLTLTMDQVPKFLRPLLETDPNLLISKAKFALMRYGHQVVIGNLLTTRKRTVTVITKTDQFDITLTDAELTRNPPAEIEELIVARLDALHDAFIAESSAAQA
ncbi:DNA/pantothenate metabolism flavo protein [Dimargaris cristalligena]|uniref:DNA/pantothenate metabolism flavo protein n=1 Tax=Dimargaris cristalligena TaxID=215637 RepID=A0A4P9ZQB1_9FUNG|nr:DNA/pantothenate metabolism flavo protein [Dimargaris cristalligena]|eukprot:RKP35664.1 DNA/pantothenate metabolism flavo protein [Dimargaris cristalligena]